MALGPIGFHRSDQLFLNLAGHKLDLNHASALWRQCERHSRLRRDRYRLECRCARSQSYWRQRNNWLVWIPAARAISKATTPRSIAAAPIRFSALDHRRRRCTDVITSTCVLVIALALGVVVLLTWRDNSPPQGGAVTGGIRPVNRNFGSINLDLPQNRTGSEVINRKSGTCPVMPNWAVMLSRVRFHTMVLKPTSTVLNTRSEFGTTKSVACVLLR